MNGLAQIVTGGCKEARFRAVCTLRSISLFLQVLDQVFIFQSQADRLAQHPVGDAAIVEIDADERGEKKQEGTRDIAVDQDTAHRDREHRQENRSDKSRRKGRKRGHCAANQPGQHDDRE